MAKKKKSTKKKRGMKKGRNPTYSPKIKFAKDKDVKAACREVERKLDGAFRKLASL